MPNSRDNFEFTITPTGTNTDLELVVNTSRTSVPNSEGVMIQKQADGSYKVIILQVQEPIEIFIDFITSNSEIQNSNIRVNNDQLYIESDRNETATIYSVSGILMKSINLTAGETVITELPRDFYMVNLSGKTHKILIK